MIPLFHRNLLAASALVAVLAGPGALASDASFSLVIRDHHFTPDTLQVPAGKRIKLTIENADPTPEEFESHALNREKVIPGNSTSSIYIGPLEPGTYPFVGEFNEDTAKGNIVAK